MFQQITIVGNLGRDPEMRVTQDGKSVCNFSVAVNNGSGDNKTTAWFRVSAWNGLSEICGKYLNKGSKVLVTGVLRFDAATGGPQVFKKQDGSAGASFEVYADNVRFLSPREDAPASPAAVTPF